MVIKRDKTKTKLNYLQSTDTIQKDHIYHT